MTKAELVNLLQTINNQYWGKLEKMINDTTFLEVWYEELGDCDYETLKYANRKYNDQAFPPTAKYFRIFYDKLIEENADARKDCLFRIWQCAAEGYDELKYILDGKMEAAPLIERKGLYDEIANQFTKGNYDRASFREWLDEH